MMHDRFRDRLQEVENARARVDNTGGPPNDGDMDSRLTALETDVSALKTDMSALKSDVAVIKANYATKADVAEIRAAVADIRADIHKSLEQNSKWIHEASKGLFATFVIAGVGLMFTIWNASKSTPALAPQQASTPIVIQVPAMPQAPVTPAPGPKK